MENANNTILKLNELKEVQDICLKLSQIGNLQEYKSENPVAILEILGNLLNKYNTIKEIQDDNLYQIYAIESIMEMGDINPGLKAISDGIVGYYANEENMEKSENQLKITAKINEFLGEFVNVNESIDYITEMNNLDDSLENLVKLGDFNKLQETNPEKAYEALKPVVKSYYYLLKDSKDNEYISYVQAILLDYLVDNPSLKGIAFDMIHIQFGESKKFDKDTFIQTTYNLVDEFESQKGIDTNNVDDFEAAFQKLASILSNNKENFSNQEYEDLVNILGAELNKIDKFNQVIQEKVSRIASL